MTVSPPPRAFFFIPPIMGRTLHYRVVNPDKLNDGHLNAMLAVSDKYNTGPFANVWTCENFFFDPLSCFPDRSRGHDWKSLENRSEELARSGLSRLAVRRRLIAEGVGKRFSSELQGFTKVGGNEWNAALVYAALLEISRLTPAVIKLSDEGEFLLCNLLIKKGKARPDGAEMAERIAYWEKEGYLKENRYGCADKARLFRKLLKQEKKWQAPEKFCRQVNPEDFAAHPEYNAGEIMAGFHGEYYGMTDKNPFDESMHAVAEIFRIFGGEKDIKIEVTPKLRRDDSPETEK